MMKETMSSKEPIEIQEEEEYINEHIYGLLLMLTTGEANNTVQSHPDNGLVGWKKLHERWWKKTEMGATLIAEQI
eukprot:8414645-Karenia_brevis.AAC.1